MTPALAAWRARTEVALLIIAIGSLPILLLETVVDELPSGDRFFVRLVDVVVLVVFAVDYVVGAVLARDRLTYLRGEWPNLLIVAAQAVALVPALSAFGALRALRAGRLVRFLVLVARVVAVGGRARASGRRVLRRNAARMAFGVAGMTWLVSAVGFTLAEDVGVDGRIPSFFDALWWSLATITTVGYGDIYPITTGGRLIGAFTMLIGISTFAVVTARIAQFLIDDRADDA